MEFRRVLFRSALYPGDANLELRIMISDGLLFTISYGIGDPTVDGRLPPASAVDANLDLARERAFRNFAVEGRTRQTGTCEHGFDTDDPFEIGQARDSRVWLSQAEMAELFQTTKPSISLQFRDRKSAVAGKGVCVRVSIGGRR